MIPSCPSAVRFLQSAQWSSRDVTALGMWKGGKHKGAEVFLKTDCDKHGVRSCMDAEACTRKWGYGESGRLVGEGKELAR